MGKIDEELQTVRLSDGRELYMTMRLYWDETGTVNGAPARLRAFTRADAPDDGDAPFPQEIEDEELIFNTLQSHEKTIAELLVVCEKAAMTFRQYAALHYGKGTPEGDQKAKANVILAEEMENAIKKAKGEGE